MEQCASHQRYQLKARHEQALIYSNTVGIEQNFAVVCDQRKMSAYTDCKTLAYSSFLKKLTYFSRKKRIQDFSFRWNIIHDHGMALCVANLEP